MIRRICPFLSDSICEMCQAMNSRHGALWQSLRSSRSVHKISPKRYAPDLVFVYLLHDHSERRNQIILGMSSAINSKYILCDTMCFVWISRSVNFPDFQLSVFELFVIVNLWGHHRLCMERRGQRRWSGHQGVVVVVVVVVWSLWLCEDILLLDCLRFNFHGCLCVCVWVFCFSRDTCLSYK